jgi:hypothetical protein
MRLKNMKNKIYLKQKCVCIFSMLMVFILQSLLFNLTSSYAQTSPRESLRVTPIINDLKLIPGKPTTVTLTIENISQNPVGIHADINGLDALGDSQSTSQTPSKMVDWTSLSTNDIVLGEKEKKTFTVVIQNPVNINKSGYYETIFLTPITHQQDVANSPIILSRVGVLVLGTVGNLNFNDLAKKVSVSDITPSKKIINNFPQDISFTIANNYFSHFDAKPFITITPLFAKSQTVLLSDKHVLPGSVRIWHYQPTVSKNHIFYQMHLAISVGGGKQIFADTWFVVLPYQPVVLAIIIFILLYIGIAKRKRLGKFISILLKG